MVVPRDFICRADAENQSESRGIVARVCPTAGAASLGRDLIDSQAVRRSPRVRSAKQLRFVWAGVERHGASIGTRQTRRRFE